MSDHSPDAREKRFPEILAPAGSGESLFAAVAAGADAVYLGGRRFGARHFAANFSQEEMREALEFAHSHGVAVYVTVNTLVQDRELPAALGYLLSLYGMGVDAVLIQDMGLLALSRDLIPGLVLHASTQCTISAREGVEWAKTAGFSRVVLAREVPVPEIDRIVALPSGKRPGIEVFVHGALCYSYSGQCLLSSVIGGRSGNRGMCAQPCRKPYRLVRWTTDAYSRITELDEVPCRDRYLLSTRDLCCYPGFGEILKRKVDALKIEGRMRSPEYVAVVVRAYRKALDALAEGREWKSPPDMDEMAAAFNRGFTRGYLLGDRDHALMGRERPDHRGLFLGSVISSPGGGGILVRPSSGYVPVAGDGILIVDPSGGDRVGCALNKDAVLRGDELFIPGEMQGIRPGSRVSLTGSTRLPARLKEILHTGSRRFGIPVEVRVRVAPGEPLEAEAWCRGPKGHRLQVTCTTGYIPESARNSPTAPEIISRQMQKAGETSFRVRRVDLDYRGEPFIPVGELNRLRRELLSTLRHDWLLEFHPCDQAIEEATYRVRTFGREYADLISRCGRKDPVTRNPVLTVYCGTPDELIAACDAGCDAVCYEPERVDWNGYLQDLVEGVEYCSTHQVSFTWKWPRITGASFLAEALPRVPGLFGAGVTRIMVEEPGMAEAILSRELEMELLGGQGLNIYNACAARAFHPLITWFTLSPELSSAQMATLIGLSARVSPDIRYETVCQGNLETMVSEDRLLTTLAGTVRERGEWQFGLQDETGRVFPVYEDREGRTHLLNAVETTLIDHVPDLLDMGFSSLAIDARTRGPVYAKEMTGLYRECIEAASRGERSPGTWKRFKERARKMVRGGITTGHFTRGVAGYPDTGAE
ncbi:MAG: DUF3656 domain-containing protein [Methanolinea sp.]|nr:DUF3656 domain-containing protein [Methanolinea sp.]